MIAKYEDRQFDSPVKVWLGKYADLENMAHWHKEVELIYLENGNADIGINRICFHAVSGDTFYIKSGDIHYIRAEKGSIIKIIIFDFAYLQGINDYESAEPMGKYPFLPLYDQIQTELYGKKIFYEYKIQALLLDFMIHFLREQPVRKGPEQDRQNSLPLYRRLLSYIDGHYADVTFEQAAKIMGFTPSHFSKLFAMFSGTTFTKYLNAVRIEKAIGMLKEGQRSITDVSLICGFRSIRHFNRVFKQLTGLTPREITPAFVFDMNPTKIEDIAADPTLSGSKLLDE